MSEALVGLAFGAAFAGLAALASSLRCHRGPLPELHYWNIRGLAQPIRNALRYAGAAFRDVVYTQGGPPNFSTAEWTSVKPQVASNFTNLPFWKEPNGAVLTESKAILQHIGRRYGLYGKSAADQARVDEIISHAEDIRGPFTSMCYSAEFAAKREAYLKDYKAKFTQLEIHMEAQHTSGSTWTVGHAVTIADFFVFEVLEAHLAFDPTLFDTLPHLKAFHAAVSALPTVAVTRASLPPSFNNKVSKWSNGL